MKLSAIALTLLLQSVSVASDRVKMGGSRTHTDVEDLSDNIRLGSSSRIEDHELVFWKDYVDVVSSMSMPPTPEPTFPPTKAPTNQPTALPTPLPTHNPTTIPTSAPTASPTRNPTPAPTEIPTPLPTQPPTRHPTANPTSAPTPGPTPGPTTEPTALPTSRPTALPTSRPTALPTSRPTALPTSRPTALPTSRPTALPTSRPTPNPTPLPTFPPTPGPTDPPTPLPTQPPTPGPTDPPTPLPTQPPSRNPTANPTSVPTRNPTARPTPLPTPDPTPLPTFPPTMSPTGQCVIQAGISCTTMMDNAEIPCVDLTSEDQPSCTCSECVREVQFRYTGKLCSSQDFGAGRCTDEGPSPFLAGYRVTGCASAGDDEVYATGETQQGETVTIGAPDGQCLPACMTVTISTTPGVVTQRFQIDSACGSDDRGLVLVSDYGAFQSIGYSCSETDTHNCFQDVAYDLDICNTGSTDEQLYEWSVDLNGIEINLLGMLDDTNLTIDNCKNDTFAATVDRCSAYDSSVSAIGSAVDPETGLPPGCEDSQELTFGWDAPPTLPPTPAPTAPPTSTPSSSPTEICLIDVELTQCPQYNGTALINSCEGRPMVITFRHNGGDCSQSLNFQSRQKFQCTDNVPGGPPTVLGTPNYVVATKAGGGDVYFAGPVNVGDTFILNEDEVFDKLSADMTIQMFDEEGGTLLQTNNVHLSCSQQLYLFDRFGANQVVEWKETSGRIVSAKQADIPTGTIQIKINTDVDVIKPIKLTEMNLIVNALQFPIDYTDDIAGVILDEGTVIELEGPRLDIDLSVRASYSFFLALNGETLDGTPCNGSSFLECELGYNLDPIFATAVPTASPTTTPYPTGALETTACEVDAEILCTVTSIPKMTCDEIEDSGVDACSAEKNIFAAYLKYDGSLGDSVFVVIECDGETFIDRTVAKDETVEIITRFEVCPDGELEFNVFDVDPEEKGNDLQSSVIPTTCPGPWTLGATVVNGFTLSAFVDTTDFIQFDYHIDEVEVELSYKAVNTGRLPLNILDASFGSDSLNSLTPIALDSRDSAILQFGTEVIKVGGRAGETDSYSFSIQGQTANEFALPCVGETSRSFEL